MTDTNGTEFEGIADDLSGDDKAQLDAIRSGKSPEPVRDVHDDIEAADDADGVDDDVEAKQGDEHPAKEEKKRDGRVPLRKLMAAEEKQKAAEKELSELREKHARVDERLNMLFAAQQQAQQQRQVEEIPDPKTDPIGAIEYQQKALNQQAEYQARQQQAQQEQAFIADVDRGYKRDWNDFATQTPDAFQAYQYWTQAVSQNLKVFGIPDAQIEAELIGLERRAALAARQAGQSPAQAIYEAAKTFGYAPKTAEQKPVVDADRRVEMRQKGQAAAKSLSNVGGQRGDGTPSVEELASMSDDDFMELRNRMSDRQWQRMLGAN